MWGGVGDDGGWMVGGGEDRGCQCGAELRVLTAKGKSLLVLEWRFL